MAESGWSPYYVIVCDDIRQEVSGKQILIGVYNETIVTQSIPALMPTLAFRVAVRLERSDFKTCKFRFVSPSGDVVLENGGDVQAQGTDEHVTFSFHGSGAILDEIGDYIIEFGLDEDIRNIGRMRVRFPGTDEERNRFTI